LTEGRAPGAGASTSFRLLYGGLTRASSIMYFPPRVYSPGTCTIIKQDDREFAGDIVSQAREKYSITRETFMGVSPPSMWLHRCDKSRTGITSSSLSAGAAWGDRHSPPSSYPCFVFPIKRKRNSPEPFPHQTLLQGKGKSEDCRGGIIRRQPPVSGERVVPWKRDHTWRRYPDIKEIHSVSSRGIVTRKIGKSFYRV
jgi:hypothetical protein